ncbi:hypothetical protein GWI33_005414 [Rhynchophorus ferrugineus]|uniref:Uncharacterized protein n=1 Tax=Rhynchophorus ferrugineus TaxID=354439 RepID=A0A834IJB3_RHYFE|nr:hypothetical protein GWI33_005414 [Rhynchophorus ferrugineus]
MVVLNITPSLQKASCPPNEELVCKQKVCGQPQSGLCRCQCVGGYYRDLETNQCVNNACGKHFAHGPVLFCTANERVLCNEQTCSISDENRCSCQCKEGYYKDPASNKCVTQCPVTKSGYY